jgi:hypothetical protein
VISVLTGVIDMLTGHGYGSTPEEARYEATQDLGRQINEALLIAAGVPIIGFFIVTFLALVKAGFQCVTRPVSGLSIAIITFLFTASVIHALIVFAIL